MLDGRVKTLHPAVHGGILARRHLPEDLAAIGAHGIQPIDLVVVNLYPFAKAAANPATAFDALIEEIDIGGPSMVRAAAKNFRDVLIVVDPHDYPRVLEDLSAPGGSSPAFRFELSRRAFAHTAAYDATIASTLETIGSEADPFARPAESPALPATMRLSLPQRRVLRYGENPHQPAAWYADRAGAGLQRRRDQAGQGAVLHQPARPRRRGAHRARVRRAGGGGHQARQPVRRGHRRRRSPQAYVTARDADALSAFGGIIGLNRALDVETAQAIVTTFIEAVIAPAVDEAALAILAAKKNLRVLTADFAPFRDAARPGVELRSILGGVLVQERDRVVEARDAVARAAGDGAARRDDASADGGGVAGAALRLARLRAHQVEHDPVHRRRIAPAPSAPAR